VGLFKKIVQELNIDFYSRREASVRFESLLGQQPDDSMVNYYFLTYYAKMLYNLGPGLNSQALHLFISDIAASALYDKAKIDESLILVGYRGKGTKTYSAEWDEKGVIKTKVAWGEEDYFAKASVLIFFEFLNQTLPELSRQKLFYCIYEFQNAVAQFGIPKIKDILDWSSQIVTEVETNLHEYHKMREESKKQYKGNK
jgi:hypothetical protein